MKNSIIIFAVLFTFLSFNKVNAQDKTNQFDSNGKKNGLWKGVFEESKRPRYEGNFENGIEVGLFKYFDDTKAKSLLATREFSEKGTVAHTIFYDQKNSKVSEGKTVNRVNEGIWKYYHKGSNQLMTVENYKNGKLDGIRTVYFPSGAIAEEATYKNGQREGIYKVYLENGVVSEESHFVKNEYEGEAIFRDPYGKVVSKGNFVKNARKGIWEFYKDGKLEKTEKYPLRVNFKKRTNIPKL